MSRQKVLNVHRKRRGFRVRNHIKRVSTRPRLSWSSELIDLASCTGLRAGLTNTAHPRRMLVVQAAANAIVSSELKTGAEPKVCSCVQALPNPSASARSKCPRNRAESNVPSGANCGMEMARSTTEEG